MFSHILFIFFLLVWSQATPSDEEIDYYVNLIADATRNATIYQWPVNADEYYSSTKYQDYGSYDFVVIGGGAGGSVAASRLSEIDNWNVLLLEAGDAGNNVTDIPHMVGVSYFTHYNWAFNTTKQKTCCLGLENHVCHYPRGRGLGGSTLINGLAYARGYKYDYDILEKISGDKRWGYDSVLRYFKKSENFVHNDPEAPYEPNVHGTGGYLNVEYHKPRSPQLNAFLDANKELGYGLADYNANKLGASPSQLNTIKGRRLDDAEAFLGPAKNRKNLKILTDSYVTKIRIRNKVAVGVEFSRKGSNYFVEAKKEVILAAGSFGSPQILMLSGIGPKKHLEKFSIELVADLEVGTSLRDNAAFYGITIRANYTEPTLPQREYVKEFLQGEGPLTSNNDQGIGFYESSYTKGTGIAEIELQQIVANATDLSLSQKIFGLTDQTYEALWKHNNIPQSFNIWVAALHTKSVGSLRLKSKDPYDYPLINSNFISDPEDKDINTIYDGIQIVLKLLETEAFKSINATLQGGPLPACSQYKYLSNDYWFCAIRQLTINFFHPIATCAIGTEPKKGAVVNSKLEVFGVENLRVADASVFPLPLAAHTNAPTVMVGEQLGDLVKLKYLSRCD